MPGCGVKLYWRDTHCCEWCQECRDRGQVLAHGWDMRLDQLAHDHLMLCNHSSPEVGMQ